MMAPRMAGPLRINEPQLADLQRLVAHINAIVAEKIEGVQPDLFIAPHSYSVRDRLIK